MVSGNVVEPELFCDIRVFNLFAPPNKKTSIASSYRSQEKEKKRHYNQRITEVEQGSFSPLIFSSTGGMGQEATIFYKRLASMLSEKWDQHLSITMGWLRSILSFSLLHSAVQFNRGACSTQGRLVFQSHHLQQLDVIHIESKFDTNCLHISIFYCFYFLTLFCLSIFVMLLIIIMVKKKLFV